ncbi:MAG: amino acid transporter [Gammaproteobacteria bacterium]|jgi:amino acid transporter|nr:amino acid transporter [Gammaproteobacteria bacterium]
MSKSVPAKILSTFSLVMITITCVDSVRNLPASALFGSSVVFFFILSAIVFFIPTALICAELSTTWPEQGGIYTWGKMAFGKGFGLFTVWFQWIENVIWYPLILSFIAGTLTYLITPQLANNKFYVFALINIVFWICTWINLKGLKLSAKLTEIFGMLGLIVPMLLIIALGLIWLLGPYPHQISFSKESMLPHWSDTGMWISLSAIVMSLTGVEITTIHAAEVKNPQKSYPRALLISTIFILLTLILGSLAIALVIPSTQLNLISGIMDAFSDFLSAYHLAWLTPIVAVSLILGAVAGLNNWIIGPTKGLMIAAQDGYLPPFLQKQNSKASPTNLLYIQGAIVTVLSSLFLFMPSVNSSYWLLNVLTTQLYMLMYLCVFFAFLRLRYKHPDAKRPFRVPGGKIGMWLISLLGILSMLFTVYIGFIPPAQIPYHSVLEYEAILGIGLVVFCLPPLIMHVVQKDSWQLKLASNLPTDKSIDEMIKKP